MNNTILMNLKESLASLQNLNTFFLQLSTVNLLFFCP